MPVMSFEGVMGVLLYGIVTVARLARDVGSDEGGGGCLSRRRCWARE